MEDKRVCVRACVGYLCCFVDVDCVIQVDVLGADEFTVSLQQPQLKLTRS